MASPSLALVLHGRLGSWLLAASELDGTLRRDAQKGTTGKRITGSNASAPYRAASSSNAALRAFAGFTHSTIWQRAVVANRQAGATVRVVIHSWSPEVGDVLDSLYHPAASVHEPPQPALDKVASQHLSIRKALALLTRLDGPPDDLIMVARIDLLLFSDVPLARLATDLRSRHGRLHRSSPPSDGVHPPPRSAPLSSRDVLYLPHTCVPSRMRMSDATWASESRVLRRTCSGGQASRGTPTGRRMLPAQLTRYQPGTIHGLAPSDDFTLFVLDYFFIGTPAVAQSFADLAATLPETTAAIQAKFRHRREFPRWSHLYWAHHVRATLVPAGVRLRFVLLHESDFNIARFWRFGADCLTRVRRRLGAGAGGAEATTEAGAGGGGDDAWHTFENVTRMARSMRGVGGAALAASPFAEQCPTALESASHVLCPWFSRACAERAAATLEYATAAGRFQASASLPPRQLMSAERCMTPACLRYEGTARKRRRGDAAALTSAN